MGTHDKETEPTGRAEVKAVGQPLMTPFQVSVSSSSAKKTQATLRSRVRRLSSKNSFGSDKLMKHTRTTTAVICFSFSAFFHIVLFLTTNPKQGCTLSVRPFFRYELVAIINTKNKLS